MSGGPTYYQPPPAPMCPGHAKPCRQLTTRKPGPNIGRPFWVCSQPRDQQCKFFEWADQPSKKRPRGSGNSRASKYSAPGSNGPKMKLELRSTATFTIRISTPCSKPMSELVQRMRIVAHSDFEYICHTSKYEEFVKEAKAIGYNVYPIPKEVLSTLSAAVAIDQAMSLEEAGEKVSQKLSSSLYTQLYPFQRQAVAFGVQRNGRLIIGDEMGLGKTISALAIAAYFQSLPVLIVVPSSVKMNWKNEILQFCNDALLQGRGANRIQIFETGKDKYAKKDVTIISYSLAEILSDTLASCNFGTIIADESHSLKNPKAKRTKALVPLLKKAKRCILLSGTPALSRPAELFPQLQALKSSIFRGFTAFGKRYCAGVQKPFGWDFSGSSNTEELSLLLKTSVMIRRTKKEILKDLPKKTRKVVSLSGVSQNNEQAEVLGDLVAEVHSRGGFGSDGKPKLSSNGREKLMQLYVDTATLKIPPVLEYVSKMLDTGMKFLVFAHHQVMLNALDDHLESQDVDFIRIDGKTSSAQRAKLVKRFQSDSSCQVAVLSITAAGQGITLTAAHTVVFAELSWTPGMLLQCEDRVHRIGQVSEVDVIFLVGKDSMDEKILWPMISKKLQVLQSTIGGHTEATTDFSTTAAATGSKYQPLTIDKMFSRQKDDGTKKRRQSAPKIDTFFKQSPRAPAAPSPSSFYKRSGKRSPSPATPAQSSPSIVISLSSSEDDEIEEDDDVFHFMSAKPISTISLKKKPRLATEQPKKDQNRLAVTPTRASAPPVPARRKQRCAYGLMCYRKNPAHFERFLHPAAFKRPDRP